MEGPDIENEVEMGVIPRSEALAKLDFQWKIDENRMVWSIFDGIDHVLGLENSLLTRIAHEAADYIEFVVKVAIVEIYNERIRDLLDPKKDNLKIHEDKE